VDDARKMIDALGSGGAAKGFGVQSAVNVFHNNNSFLSGA
jgi:hypothetical protein